MRLKFFFILIISNLLLPCTATATANANGNNEFDVRLNMNNDTLRILDIKHLVEQLQYEFTLDQSTTLYSNTHEMYDIVVGEILRRKDKNVISLLILKINSKKELIWSNSGNQKVTFRYENPMQLKYKIRFVLRKLLGNELFSKIIVKDPHGDIDIQSLKIWVKENMNNLYINPRREKIKIKLDSDVEKEIPVFPVFLLSPKGE